MADESPFPPLHGKDFGTTDKYSGNTWVGRFLFMKPRWAFVFLNEGGVPTWEISGIGETPLIAFEDCVQVWIGLNEGKTSEALKEVLSFYKDFFNEDGGVKLEYLLGEV